jgi:hypothetical protein
VKNTQPKKLVRRIVQSPMNRVIWVVELECGHDTTLVSKSRPRAYSLKTVDGDVLESRRRLPCPRCPTEQP